MKVFKDIMSGEEMVSDSYPNQEIFGGAALEVRSRLITKKINEDFGISGKTYTPSFTSMHPFFQCESLNHVYSKH